jgi:alpha-glucosidase
MKYGVLSLMILLLANCKGPEVLINPIYQLDSYSTPNFRLEQNPSELLIYLENNLEEPVLILPLDRPFLIAERVQQKVDFNRGSFHFDDKREDRCQVDRIERIEPGVRRISIIGQLCDATDFELRVEATSGRAVYLQVSLADETRYNHLRLRFQAEKEEEFYGLGAQYTHVALNGQRIPIWVGEQGIGRGDQPITFFSNFYDAGGDAFTTSAPVPFFLSTKNRAFHLAEADRMEVDLRDPEWAEVKVWGDRLRLAVFQADTPKTLIDHFTSQAGKPPLLPDWAFGSILGVQGGERQVRNHIATMEAADSPVDAIWIQDWVGQRQTFFGQQLNWYWEPDTTLYPDLKGFCQDLAEKDIAVLGYINPFLTDQGFLYDFALREGFFVRQADGTPYPIDATGFTCYLVDLTNPEAYQWFKQLIKDQLIARGFSGWMADFGEWLPADAQLYNGLTGLEYHNIYAEDWARLNREAITEMGMDGRVAFFSRAAFSETLAWTPFYWLGDQLVSWGENDGLPSTVRGLLSAGMSGMAINHSDVGGFTTIQRFPVKIIRDRELLQRWIELNAFTPVFRTHEGIRPLLNLQVYDDEEIAGFYAQFGRLRAQLLPYLKALNLEAARYGTPMVRHLYLEYPDDPTVRELDDQFLLGADCLVIPVLEKGKTTRKGYLPTGRWRYLWNGEIFEGGSTYRWEAPIGQPPVFIRVGSGLEADFFHE